MSDKRSHFPLSFSFKFFFGFCRVFWWGHYPALHFRRCFPLSLQNLTTRLCVSSDARSGAAHMVVLDQTKTELTFFLLS